MNKEDWRRVAYFLAGQLSTTEGFTDKHPEEVLQQAVDEIEEDAYN